MKKVVIQMLKKLRLHIINLKIKLKQKQIKRLKDKINQNYTRQCRSFNMKDASYILET